MFQEIAAEREIVQTPGMSTAKRILLWLMAAFYAFSGYNHLMNPDFYLAIMPPGLPNPEWLNLLSGLAEIVLGGGGPGDGFSGGRRAESVGSIAR